jgi:hypothetical protein
MISMISKWLPNYFSKWQMISNEISNISFKKIKNCRNLLEILIENSRMPLRASAQTNCQK